MHPTIARIAFLGAGTAAVLAMSGGVATATPACNDAVVGVLHAAHDTTGDPAGVIHDTEETYCSVG